MLLAAVDLQDRKAVRRQGRRLLEPGLHGGLGHRQQFRREPGGGGVELGEQRGHPLKAPGHRLIARVHVALQLRVAVQAVLQFADVIEREVGLQHRVGAVLQRALERSERRDLGLHLAHAGFPGVPVRVDGAEVPAELGGDLAAVARGFRGGSGSLGDCGESQGSRERHDGPCKGGVHEPRLCQRRPSVRRRWPDNPKPPNTAPRSSKQPRALRPPAPALSGFRSAGPDVAAAVRTPSP